MPRSSGEWGVCRTKTPPPSTMLECVGVVGASGAVGKEMIKCLGDRGFPTKRLRLFARRSAGQVVQTALGEVTIEPFSLEVGRCLISNLHPGQAPHAHAPAHVAASPTPRCSLPSTVHPLNPQFPSTHSTDGVYTICLESPLCKLHALNFLRGSGTKLPRAGAAYVASPHPL